MFIFIIVGMILVIGLVMIDLAIIGIAAAVMLGIGAWVWFSGGAALIAAAFWIAVLAYGSYLVWKHRNRLKAKWGAVMEDGLIGLPGDKLMLSCLAIFFGTYLDLASLGI